MTCPAYHFDIAIKLFFSQTYSFLLHNSKPLTEGCQELLRVTNMNAWNALQFYWNGWLTSRTSALKNETLPVHHHHMTPDTKQRAMEIQNGSMSPQETASEWELQVCTMCIKVLLVFFFFLFVLFLFLFVFVFVFFLFYLTFLYTE